MDSVNRYPGRACHWIRHNHTERMPHRWIVADSEAHRMRDGDTETQTLRCVDATRWRDDLKHDDQAEDYAGESAPEFWQWVDEWTRAGTRTVLWFHNASYDLRTLDAFRCLPALGWQLDWCNLDRDVSVATWRSGHGTLVIADTWTWLAKPLSDVSGMVGIGKPPLPDDDDSLAAWHRRCAADVAITRAAVLDLTGFVRDQHLGNWQPSGAGMGYATWRHRFLDHKVLVHDDAPALAAERAAMHSGRAEAWWHGKAKRGPFTEWDMHMAYCRIAAECDVPVKLFAYDGKPTAAVHQWAMKHWTVLCRVRVTTERPVVPHQTGERIIWPTGTFETTLWQPELELITRTGGSYQVLEQWRYNMAPALRGWARWSMDMCAAPDSEITPVQRAWVKHQSRAVIGRLALRTATWEQWGGNPYGWCGMSTLVDGETGESQRMMHVGDRTFTESAARESQNSLPQITGYIMAVARVRLWDACMAAGEATVQHVDTDSLIVNRDGSVALRAAAAAVLPGGWRPKETWSKLDVTGPRHYRSTGRRVIPGVPRAAVESEPGIFRGETWESLATSLEAGRADQVRLFDRTWHPRTFDGRRPWTVEGPAEPIRLPAETPEGKHDGQEQARRRDGPPAGDGEPGPARTADPGRQGHGDPDKGHAGSVRPGVSHDASARGGRDRHGGGLPSPRNARTGAQARDNRGTGRRGRVNDGDTGRGKRRAS